MSVFESKNNKVIKSSDTFILFFVSFICCIIISIGFNKGFLILAIISSALFAIWFTSKVYYRLYFNEKGFELIFPTRLSKFRKMTYVFSGAMITSTPIQEMSFSILDRVEVYERAGVRSGHTVRFYTEASEPSNVTIEMSTAKVMIFLQHLKGKTSVEVCTSLQSYFSRIE